MNEREHIWCDAVGQPVLKHVKYTRDGVKHFPWYTWLDFGNGTKPRWYKGKDPSVVAPLLYPMPEFVRANRSEHIYIVEGEADQEAAQAAGLLAVTAGPAGAFGREHARLFKGWRGLVTIVRDNDLPGAWGAAKAYDALGAVGIPASRLRVARGRIKGHGADLRDHLEAGHAPDRLISEPIAKVRRLAAKATPAEFARCGYSGGVNPETGWVVVGADEAAQLRDWKTVSS